MNTTSKTPKFPRGLRADGTSAPLATSMWFPVENLEKQAQAGSGLTYREGRIWFGRTTDNDLPIGYVDDRHIVTVAGSRAGKGISAIIPALCDYPGSVICIDPKGENAWRTSARRGFGKTGITGMHQDVYVLDPYDVSEVEREYIATFDPLAAIRPDAPNAIEEAGLIADALVVSGGDKDSAHFEDSARAFIEALILHVTSWPEHDSDRSLGKVRMLARDGDTAAIARVRDFVKDNPRFSDEQQARLLQITPFEALLKDMGSNGAYDGIIMGAATALQSISDRERGSVLSTVRRHLKFLDAPRMRACLQPSDHTLALESLKRAPHGASVFIVLPSRLMATHSRWMRLILNLTVARMEADSAPPATGHPVLAILDEFPALRRMPVMETAIGYMAGFGLKIWAILQDLSQLKRDYESSWETFLGNAGTLQFFGNSDPTTLDFIARRLGEIEIIRETTNTSKSDTQQASDISDLDKVERANRPGLGPAPLRSFALENSTETQSRSSSESTSVSQSIHKTSLMTPDEIRRFFSRSSGLQIIALADFRPIFLKRRAYFQDKQFDGKYNRKPSEISTQ